jgi:hypothetical protein
MRGHAFPGIDQIRVLVQETIDRLIREELGDVITIESQAQ